MRRFVKQRNLFNYVCSFLSSLKLRKPIFFSKSNIFTNLTENVSVQFAHTYRLLLLYKSAYANLNSSGKINTLI